MDLSERRNSADLKQQISSLFGSELNLRTGATSSAQVSLVNLKCLAPITNRKLELS